MTSGEITGPSLQAPTLPRGASQIDSYPLLSTQGGPGERGPRGTPGVRGPRGDPVSHALGDTLRLELSIGSQGQLRGLIGV